MSRWRPGWSSWSGRPVKVQQRSSGGCWRTLQGLADFGIVQSYLSTAAKWGLSKLDALRDLFHGPPGYRLASNHPDNAIQRGSRARLPVTCAPWRHLPVESDWDCFISRCQQVLADLVEGRPEPFRAPWSHADDVVISARIDWAAAGIKATDRAAENIMAVVGDNLAYTVDLEHMTRHAGDHPTPRTLRRTQAYRRENGEWKIILRHADKLPDKDEQQR